MSPQHRLALTGVLLVTALAPQSSTLAQKEKKQDDKPAADKAKTTPDKPTALQGARQGSRDRWLIKTASDAEAQEIDRKPQASSVEKLLAIPRPIDMPLDGSNPFFQNHRARPAETTVFSLEADIVDYRQMPDGDYQVTIKGASGKTLKLEMPNPAPEFVDPASKFASDVKAAREQFDGKFHPGKPEKADRTVKQVVGHARITGVGFFARNYGSSKVEGNLLQIHPVLKIEGLEKPTEEFVAPKEEQAKK